MIKVCFLNAIQWLDFIRVSSAVSPDVLLWMVQLCSLVLTSPGSDGDIVSALWVYIRHYGDQRPVSGSVTLRCKMGHSVATCKYQDSSSVLPGHAVRGGYCGIWFRVEHEMKSTNFANC